MFTVCVSSFREDTVLAVIDLRQRVIARDQSHRSPVWPYQSRCYICLVTILNKKYTFLEFNRHIINVSHGGINLICQGFQSTRYVPAYVLTNQAGYDGC